MARKRKSTVVFAEWTQHVAVPLSEDMADEVVELVTDRKRVDMAFLDLAEQMFSISCKPKAEGGYVASAQVLDPESVNAGRAVYGNAPTAVEARAVLLVKLSFLGMDNDWTSLTTSNVTARYR